METYPLFSVLIANYNNGKYLMDAISSIKNQTYENWEIVIIDDASTDNSQEIYKELQSDYRIRIYYNEKNSGVGYTKRRLCELAKGEIAGFLDADDALVKTAIEIMVSEHKNTSVALLYSQFYICDSYLKIKEISTASRFIKETYLQEKIGAISHFATFKLAFYNKTTGIDINLKMAEDQDLYYKLEEVGHIKFIKTPLYLYRINPDGVSRVDRCTTEAWGIIAKYEALKRRNQNAIKVIEILVSNEKNTHLFYENSLDYRIGKLILAPFRWAKYKLLKK